MRSAIFIQKYIIERRNVATDKGGARYTLKNVKKSKLDSVFCTVLECKLRKLLVVFFSKTVELTVVNIDTSVELLNTIPKGVRRIAEVTKQSSIRYHLIALVKMHIIDYRAVKKILQVHYYVYNKLTLMTSLTYKKV